MPRLAPSLPALAPTLAALLATMAAPALAADRHESSAGPLEVTRVAGPFLSPWAVAFLPDGRQLVTERDGALKLVDGAEIRDVANPPEVVARGQGGLLDVAPAPDFAETGEVYFTFAGRADGGAATMLARGVFVDGPEPRLDAVETLWAQTPAVSGGRHFGSRIVFDAEGHVFVTTGDRGDRPRAQDIDGAIGKLIRVDRDGNPAPGNPDFGAGALPELWSIGHRNIQGADLDPETGQIWTVEHGARGGDEINAPRAGLNYGWPVISYGRHYSGGRIGEGTEKPGMEQPVFFWDPSIAPSGLTIYDGAVFDAWAGDIFVGALRGQALVRLDRENGQVVGEERLFQNSYGRIRDVETGPDGALWFVTDEGGDGALYRIGAGAG